MKKKMTIILKFLCSLFFSPLLAIIYSIKYILTGTSHIGRAVLVGIYSGSIVAFIYKPIVFMIVLVAFFVFDVLFSVLLARDFEKNEQEGGNNSNTYQKYNSYENRYFDGMTLDEAKKEYRKLMKKYHPDNIDGNLEMTQIITEAYSKYCVAYGK